MTYVALLRGINVGGKSIIAMSQLKTEFELLGFNNVKTYINSGNVIFTANNPNVAGIERSITAKFGHDVRVTLRDLGQMKQTVAAMKPAWANDKTQKCDVMFVWPEYDRPDALDEYQLNPEFEDRVYTPGAFIWRLDSSYRNKTKLYKIVGTPLYKGMTIRNANTARKLLQLMQATSD
jgi:uncharacterized protein (DUF1697 family)